MDIPDTTRADWSAVGRGRFGSRIQTDDPAGCSIGLIGVPDDFGVGLNGGRLGAAEGPAAFRSALGRYGTALPRGNDWPGVFDAGDVLPGGTLDETHARVTAAAGDLVDAGLVPVMIGGGHDLTFPFVRAVAQRTKNPMHGVYFDAHLDVRAEVGSGMPFRRLIEDCGAASLTLHGFDAMSNSAEHVEWFVEHGGRFGEAEPGKEPGWPGGDLFVSFDVDVIDQAHAPGVSAMNPSGWSSGLACRWARAAGACERVRCFDIMELSPPYDENGRTARLTARLFLEFLIGFGGRGS